MMEKDSGIHVELGDDAKYGVKRKGTILFHHESGGSFDAHDVFYVLGLRKKNVILIYGGKGFCSYIPVRVGTHTSRDR
jgi:hypothetical protein